MPRPWHPAPALAYVRPASVVKRRKSPRCFVNPRPSPRRDPDPASVVIGRPPDRNCRGRPDISVVRVIAPRTVLVQIFRADHIRRHVLLARCNGAFVAPIAIEAPLIERVRRAKRAEIRR